MSSVILLFSAILLAATGQILLKKGMLSVGVFSGEQANIVQYYLKVFSHPVVLIGFCFFVVSSFAWLMVLSRLPLSLAYPCAAFGYVLVTIASKLIFHENVSEIRWLGIAVICLGVFLISRSA